MKKLLNLLILNQFLFASIAFAAATNPLQGSWEWINIKNSCAETYIFGTVNTAHITSGDEISDAEYQIDDKTTEKGFYKVTLKIVKDRGGKDCGESLEDNTGDTYHKFVMFHPSGNQYVSCDKETIDECVGPLKRIE